jgi:tetratricopeptide (TPR) repeat protein
MDQHRKDEPGQSIESPPSPPVPTSTPELSSVPSTTSPPAIEQAQAASHKIDGPSDPRERIYKWLWSKGWIGIIPIFLFLAWWNWDHIRALPPIPQVLSYISRKPIQKVSENKLVIAVAHLENDPEDKNEKLLLAELEKFEGLTVQPIDRRLQLPLEGTLQENIAQGHKQARVLLAQSGAEALIWGSVLEHDGHSTLQLRWTPEQGRTGLIPSGRYEPDADLNLPPIFWEDLTKVLGLIVETRIDTFSMQIGTYQADKLKPFIADTKLLLSSQRAQWQPMDRASVEFALAYALQTFGDQAGDNASLLEATQRYASVASVWTRELFPLAWAGMQNNLGNTYLRIGERELGTQHLHQAVEAFQGALKERTRERVPLDWAMTKNNLGSALVLLGERESRTLDLQAAIEAFREALKEYTRERVPLNWAGTQSNLGSALHTLGERESGSQHSLEAVEAFQEALKEYTREKAPLNWAGTQVNLGSALATLGERESGSQHLQQAIEAFQQALKEYTRERVPLDWAMTQSNLGNALLLLGERESGTQHLQQAVAALEQALEVFRAARATYYVGITEEILASAMAELKKKQESAR